ncbi:hypothetical protein AU490_13765 [Lonsdalea populi]|uniref:hypothetical protein n=1 Tax=Lonsdalea TaxID=1082702 RepID=UPI000DCA3C6A|nr:MULTISPECIES: hypothetical protein [Lonsdalea]RAT17399.1 hypothetical protein AU486_04545 [Lonsdalea quercina]RAT26541.1 hypothetical protein AU490_13765 [Lonsdalea populi]RAT36285.1 hypothetical protein AU491_06900 [Lonsdalea populi]RAT46945.1 hypothetical protein AU496_07595 [Lonsdalea populi]RAT53296.1 hypothetical protein AU498_06810 [Lonsdalea populi]
MDQTKQQHAYQRGARVARLWKKVKGSVLHWDERCVTWANKKHLPTWIGHAPIIIFIAFFISTIVFGGLIIAVCFLFIFAVACITQNPSQSQTVADETETKDCGSCYRNGNQGYGLYSGPEDLVSSYRMDQEE